MAEVFFKLGADYHSLPDTEELPPGAIVVPRMPEDGESWGDKGFTVDKAALAAMMSSEGHVKEAYTQKRMEAILILSGVILTEGLLYAEAAIRGITTQEIARLVMDQAGDFIAEELARQTLKAEAAVEDAALSLPVEL